MRLPWMLFMEDGTAVFFGPGYALIDHAAGVGVAAAERVGLEAVADVPLVAGVVPVVGDGFDVVIGVRVEVQAALPLVAGTRNDVQEVGDDAGGGEEVAVLVVVEAPGVGGAVGIDFELVADGVITPDAGVERDSLVGGGARLADFAVREDAVTAVEPAVGAPDEAVERFVGVFVAESVEEDSGTGWDVFWRRKHWRDASATRPDWFAVWLIVGVFVGNKEEIGGGTDPDAAEAEFQAADEVEAFVEDGAFVEGAVEIGVFEDEDAVAAFVARLRARRGYS